MRGAEMNLEKCLRGVEHAVDHLAYLRRLTETQGHDMGYVDEKINEYCTKYHNKYAEMDELALALKGAMDIIKSGRGEELMDALRGAGEDR